MRLGQRSTAPSVSPAVLAVSSSRRASSVASETPRPVFVLGTLRSGASLLTLSLGQHPNLFQVLETNWLDRLGIGLQQAFADGLRHRNRSQLDVAGVEIEDFFAHFGEAVDRLVLRTAGDAESGGETAYAPTRWVDGTPSNAFAVFVLTRLFPAGRFIHIVRDVDETVASLTTLDTRDVYRSQFLRLSDERAYRHWIETTRACLEAERAFGSSVVLRIRRDDLIASPEPTLRRCLDFLGEPFARAVLRPFSSVGPVERPREDRAESVLKRVLRRKLREEAVALNSVALADGPTYPADVLRIAELEAAFSARCERGESGVPATLPGFRPRRRRGGGLPSWVLRTVIDREHGGR